MTDMMTPEQRTRCMQHIRGSNTKPEILVRKYLFAAGFRFRVNVRRLPGSPDILLRKYKTAIFINGCFWHGHAQCPLFRLPKSNVSFWRNKIERNQERDIKVNQQLRDLGWNVITIWECQLKPKVRLQTLDSLLHTLDQIYLMNHGQKGYTTEEECASLAAETEIQYGNNQLINMTPHPYYHVVAAIIQHHGELLCMQRGKTRFPYTSFKYEFPGGKVEPGETSEEALQREIHEEMDYDIHVDSLFMTVTHEYPDFTITMEAFLCSAKDRCFTLREHHAYQWLPSSLLDTLDWAAADAPIAQALQERGIQ